LSNVCEIHKENTWLCFEFNGTYQYWAEDSSITIEANERNLDYTRVSLI